MQVSRRAAARSDSTAWVPRALRSVPEDARDLFLGFMTILLVAAGFVLFIASVNVAAMLSARAVARRREMAVRAALGASRARLVAQMLTEMLVLFAIGAAGAVAIAFGATTWATRFPLPADIIVPPDLVPDGRVMVFALLVSLVTGVVFGLTPALRASRDDVSARLRDGAAGGGTRRSWRASSLIVGQLALSLVLLVAAGLFVRRSSVPRASMRASIEPACPSSHSTRGRGDTTTLAGDDSIVRSASAWPRCPASPASTFASFAPLTTRSMNDSVTLANGERAFTWYLGAGRRLLPHARDADRCRACARRDRRRTDRARRGRQRDVRQALGAAWQRARTDVHTGSRRSRSSASRATRSTRAFDEITPSMAFLPIEQTWQSNQTMLVRGVSPAAARARSARCHASDRSDAARSQRHVARSGERDQRAAAAHRGDRHRRARWRWSSAGDRSACTESSPTR